MTYLKFSGFLLLWGWVIAAGYLRYALPLVESVQESLDSLGKSTGLAPRVIGFLVRGLLAVVQTYIFAIWSAWCVLRTVSFLKTPGTSGWLYYVSAFLICEGVLGIVARRERYRGILSILHSTMAMGLFVVFALNNAFLASVYPWLPGMVHSAM